MPNRIISISTLTSNKLVQNLKTTKLISTIPIGVDLTQIEKVKKSKTESDIIYAGRLLSHKNIHLLIKSIKILTKSNPNIKCLIIGEGPEKAYLKEAVRKKKLERNIIFTDFIEKDSDLYSLFKSSKVFVLPSSREGFGIVVIEAHACGIPVLTIDHPNNASRNLINQHNGLVSNLSAQDIAIKTAVLLKKSARMRNNCVESARQYNWEKIIPVYEGIYRQ